MAPIIINETTTTTTSTTTTERSSSVDGLPAKDEAIVPVVVPANAVDASANAVDANANATATATSIERQRAKSSLRYVEDVSPGLRLDMDLLRVHHASVSDVQSVQVLETSAFGKTLVTDGKTQSSAFDEAVYHESLVHPAMFYCALRNSSMSSSSSPSSWAPRSVLIGGGGELATAREVLRHSSVSRVVMVDIDPDVVDVCRRHLPEWGGDAVLDHPKLEYVVGDARAYVRDTDEKFDVIIMDVSDPIEYGPAEALYNVEYYELVRSRLNGGGVFVTQAGSASFVPMMMMRQRQPGDDDDGDDDGGEGEGSCLAPIRNTLARVFDFAVPYTAPVPSFGEDWGFVLAYDMVVPGNDDGGGDDDDGSNDGDDGGGTATTTTTTTNGKTKVAHPAEVGRDVIDGMIEERVVPVPGVPDHASVVERRRRRRNENASSSSSTAAGGAVAAARGGSDALGHYDGIAHGRLFALSKPLRGSLADDGRVMTEANPIFMY